MTIFPSNIIKWNVCQFAIDSETTRWNSANNPGRAIGYLKLIYVNIEGHKKSKIRSNDFSFVFPLTLNELLHEQSCMLIPTARLSSPIEEEIISMKTLILASLALVCLLPWNFWVTFCKVKKKRYKIFRYVSVYL